ncbi:hypothetical protein CAOG_00602 [Capsaspora owczarzaki ATCC 30864]|uniref:Uncharacterized protein n=1 Tax=Capsaspora owczarzaki (strain ATCC 30864) TaxID=595528 RepID=A0A0D2X0H0_CAPO3|nr:hypothetical protein CAOG_00602 [Capsaspora owczarzaki ATCC 30864]KJE89044.1 hypothetical protein CAOG_000602 [Capsaspora owczarzaki ATCC 30864]|eukprot:XP_004365473.2 hypothetical protein CAOG_00602 [Capsaspora owczarzaki ATCC 30864]
MTHVNIHLAPATEAEKEQLAQLRSEFNEPHPAMEGEQLLLRFLRFHHHDLKATEQHVKHFFDWRQDFRIDDLTIADAKPFLKTNLLAMLDKTDSHGRPIVMVRWRNFHPESTNVADMLKAQAYLFDTLFKVSSPAPIDGFIALCDYSDWALKQSSPQLVKLTFDLARRYPFTPVTYAVNVPWYFRVVWAFAKPFMSQAAIDSFSVLSMSELAERLTPDQREPELGGTLQFNLDEWIAGRFKAEGIDEANPGAPHLAFDDALARLEVTYGSVASHARLEGSLQKQGGGGYFGTSSWKARQFVLARDNFVYYFADRKSSSKPHRTFDLATCTVEAADEKADKPHTFYLHAGDRRITLAAASDAERAKWIEALQSAINERKDSAKAEQEVAASK